MSHLKNLNFDFIVCVFKKLFIKRFKILICYDSVSYYIYYLYVRWNKAKYDNLGEHLMSPADSSSNLSHCIICISDSIVVIFVISMYIIIYCFCVDYSWYIGDVCGRGEIVSV